MIAAKSNEFEVVRDAISGVRENDETVQASAAILAERLERLKKRCNLFAEVSFSPDMLQLTRTAAVS